MLNNGCRSATATIIRRLSLLESAAVRAGGGERVDQQRRRCDRLTSPQSEQFVVAKIDGFISAGLVQEAEPFFNLFRRQGHQFKMEVYNLMLRGWVAKTNAIRGRVLYDSMPGDQVERNLQTYALMLVLSSKCDEKGLAKSIITEMQSKGLRVEHLLHSTNLSDSETSHIMKVISDYGLLPEGPPQEEIVYPRVVDSFYKQWAEDSKQYLRSSHPPILRSLFSTRESLQKNLGRQLAIELKGYETIQSVASVPENQESVTTSELTIESVCDEWKKDLTKVIQRDIEQFEAIMRLVPDMNGSFRGPPQFPFLALLPATAWADILVDQVLINLVKQPDGMPMQYICRVVGQAAWTKYTVARKQRNNVIKKLEKMYDEFVEKLQSPRHSNRPVRELWTQADHSTRTHGSLECDPPRWTRVVNSHVVGALLERLLEVATLPVNFQDPNGEREPGLEHLVEVGSVDKPSHIPTKAEDNYKKLGYIRPTRRLYQFVKTHHLNKKSMFRMSSFLLPMLVPPRPWTTPDTGGFLLSPSLLVRCPEDTYQHQLLLEEAHNLNAVYDALNYLGACPWTVNKPILELAIEVFNTGGDKALDIPSQIEFKPPVEGEEISRRELARRKKLTNESFSLWMDMLYRLSLANHYKDDVFWLPHNMDFRGRVYPLPPHLTHIAMDVGRAMLKFGVGYPLGEKGLDWLKIHIITLHGHKKKESLQERLAYANQVLDDIVDSADHPLTGNRWWLSGDDPWQVLACCIEITNAIRSGDPSKFISHLPVHQDGSCNGLQHYAAMGRDYLGGHQVNLIPQDRPEDTYTAVANVVEQLRKKDAENGNELAKILEGKIHRKVVKSTVMTVVYGVTWVGGRLQIEKQIEGHVPDEKLWDCSNYLVGNVFASIRETFTNARVIQDWLATSARKVSLAGKPMEWITPLGLPVVQPYHKPSTKQWKLKLQSVGLTTSTDFTTPPDTRRQKNGMPPNFVHSLDSTHMMLTALHCHRSGIPFVAVHDSYWTHSCFVDFMNKCCREQFVALHEEPILEDLADYWEEKFGNLEYKDNKLKEKLKCQFRDPFPSMGDLDLRQVLNSTYFFS